MSFLKGWGGRLEATKPNCRLSLVKWISSFPSRLHELKVSFKNFLLKNTFSGLQKLTRRPFGTGHLAGYHQDRSRLSGSHPPGPQAALRENTGRAGPAGASRVAESLAKRHGCTSSPKAPMRRRKKWGTPGGRRGLPS